MPIAFTGFLVVGAVTLSLALLFTYASTALGREGASST